MTETSGAPETGPPTDGTATMEAPPPTPATTEATTAEGRTEASPPSDSPAPAGEKKKPVASWKCPSDRTTMLEVAVWENEVTHGDGSKGTQYAIVPSRSYKGQDGKWRPSFSCRQHDIPVLLFLLDKAHSWCLAARTEDSTIPF
jgi:hypothetical protein